MADPHIFPITDNLRAVIWGADDNPKAVVIYFQARQQKEPVSFRVNTSKPILSSFWEMPSLHGRHWLTLTESCNTHHYAIALTDHEFLDQPFIIGLELDIDRAPQEHVTTIEIWDKKEAEPQIVYLETP